MQKYSFLFKSQQLPLKNQTFVHFSTFVFMPATRAQCNGAPLFRLCGIQYRQCSPLFWRSVPETPSYGTRRVFKGAKQPTPIRPPNLSSKTIPQCATASEIWSKLLKIFVIEGVYHTHQQLSLITILGYSHSMVEYACGSISYPSIP